MNADTVAGAMAEALDAEKLVYLTDVAGVYGDWPDEASLISRIDVDGLEKLIADGKVSEGMIPKLESCVSALQHGVRRAHILDGRLPHALLLEFFTREGVGTMVRPMSTRSRSLQALDAEQRDADLRPPAGRVRARRGHRSSGTARASEYLDFLTGLAVTSLGHAHPGGRRRDRRPGAHAAARLEPLLQRRAAAGRRAAQRAARRRRPGVLRATRAPRRTSARSSSRAGTASATAGPSAST